MNSLQCCLVFSAACSIILVIVSGHYPKERRYKPCARVLNTVNFQGKICVDDGKGGFTPESEAICKGPFKETCPEFNQASCQWYSMSYPNSIDTPKPIPCCRLKYYAQGKTWMEVYYTLQYGKDGPVYDIVEVHRMINKLEFKSFGNRTQRDWPLNVLDSSGERGLSWTIASNLSESLSFPNGHSEFCVSDNDIRCSDDIVQYLNKSYPNGFDASRLPRESEKETKTKATVKYILKPSCRDIWVDAQKLRACQILYVRHSKYRFRFSLGRFFFASFRNLMFEFMEVQVYFPTSGSTPTLRYAYWSVEEPIKREEIFNKFNSKK